ncbi:MAG: sulfite oxidase-like oxidoreductase [Planctomycetota bacterium]
MSDAVPPGQYTTRELPVLHIGDIPRFESRSWTFTIDGLVETEKSWRWPEIRGREATTFTADFHCVTTWTSLQQTWEGAPVSELLEEAGPLPEAKFVMVHADGGYTTNLPLADLLHEDVILAWNRNGEALEPKHGYPLRLIVPHLYGWKSAKWVRRLELLAEDRLGYWEERGYHRRGDPWNEERFG